MIYNTAIILGLAYPICATVIPLFPCTDGSNQGGYLCAQVMAITPNPLYAAGSNEAPTLIKQGRIPISTLSDDTIIHFPLIPAIGEIVGRTDNLVTVPGYLAMQKMGDEVTDLALIPTPIKRYVSPAGISLRSRRNIFIGLGFGNTIMEGPSRALKNFAISDNSLIINSRTEVREFCVSPDDMVFVPQPRDSPKWSLNIGGIRIVSEADSVRRQAPSTIHKYTIDSFSRMDFIPHDVYGQLIRSLSAVPGVSVVEQVDGSVRRPALVTNCVQNVQHFPALEYRMTDDSGNHLITFIMDPHEYMHPIQREDDMTGCELHVAPTRDSNNYKLGVNLFRRNLVYFERNTNSNSRIGFCEPLQA